MSSPLTQIKEIWNRLPMAGRIATIGGAAATLGLVIAIFYFGSQSEYSVLFSDLKPADAQAIVEKLKTANVPYSLTNGGTTIQIPTERISEMRLQIASAGVLSGGHVGFDLFDKTSFGATDFAQQVNFRRAIEGELAKTLEGMDELESARVHITPKKESVFSEKEEGAKASVMLRVRQGKELSNERTEAIVSLISSSVEGLDPSSVSVMDTRGRLLTAGNGGKNGGLNEAGTFNQQLDAKRKFETETAARVISLLEPIAGDGQVRADVAADVDFSQIEQTEEKYNPQSQVIRSQQSTTESRSSTVGGNAAPVVGARSNDPTSPLPAQQNQQSGSDQRGATTTNYEIDKTTRRTVGGGGRVNRLTVSVVLDHKTVNDTEVARTADELQKIQELVAAAVGSNEARGDSVVVQTMPFDKSQKDLGAAPSWLDKNKQLAASGVKYAALVIVALLLLFFVMRPAKKALQVAMAPPIEPKLLGEASEESLERRTIEDGVEIIANESNQTVPELETMMTVAELEAKMQTELETVEILPAQKIELVKKNLIEQTLRESDVVVGTLRGWLRES